MNDAWYQLEELVEQHAAERNRPVAKTILIVALCLIALILIWTPV